MEQYETILIQYFIMHMLEEIHIICIAVKVSRIDERVFTLIIFNDS